MANQSRRQLFFSGMAKVSRNRGSRELLLAKQAVLLRLCTL